MSPQGWGGDKPLGQHVADKNSSNSSLIWVPILRHLHTKSFLELLSHFRKFRLKLDSESLCLEVHPLLISGSCSLRLTLPSQGLSAISAFLLSPEVVSQKAGSILVGFALKHGSAQHLCRSRLYLGDHLYVGYIFAFLVPHLLRKERAASHPY